MIRVKPIFFTLSLLWPALAYAAPPPPTGTYQPGPLDAEDKMIGGNDVLARHPELGARGWQLLAPGVFYRFKDDGTESQVSYLDMDETSLPTVRREITELLRQADALEPPATPAAREQARVYKMHADLLREGLRELQTNLRQFGGLEAYQRLLIEEYGVPTAGLTIQEAKAALYEFQENGVAGELE